ncbi:MAG: membrane protein insertase YidC [Candidatus Omnitrophota bacterium]
MEKRTIIAIVISILMLIFYPMFVSKFYPPQEVLYEDISDSESLAEPIKQTKLAIDEEKPIVNDKVLFDLNVAEKVLSNNRYVINMTNLGASVSSIEIKDHTRFDVLLVEDALNQAGVFSMKGRGSLLGIDTQLFTIKEDTNTFVASINGLLVEKTIDFIEDNYALRSSVEITNTSNTARPYSFDLVTASNISNKEKFEGRYIEGDVYFSSSKFKKIAGGKFKDSYFTYPENIEWVALKNKYYSIIAKPDFKISGVFTNNIDNKPIIGLSSGEEVIMPGETRQYNMLVYIGPTDVDELEKVEQSFGKALNFGMLTGISMVLLSVLKFFYNIFHNYGLAIIFLTCCVSVLLFPLSFKSMQSMRKMQELQPKMEKLRADYKDNHQKLNKEMMELYKKHKVNPMGGCFPMLLQMPIFIALYQTLMRSVELKGSSFLWIKDLSMPDRAFTLPVTLPLLGDAINVLPILMIGAMILQQKLSMAKASVQTDQQKMMSSIMPVMFGFIFYSLPSGLVMYWLINTVLSSSMQSILLRKTRS